MTVNSSIKLALHSTSDKIIHIDNAERGKACNCVCLKCGEPLIAAKGKIREKHFKHTANINCTGSQETALHRLGKQILLENSNIVLPRIGNITYSDPVAEKSFLTTRPDVTAIYNGEQVFFEIAVTHLIKENKAKFLTDGSHKCVEIRLHIQDAESYDRVSQLVLSEPFNKSLLGWDLSKSEEINKNSKPISSNSNNYDWILIPIVLGIIYFFSQIFKRKRN